MGEDRPGEAPAEGVLGRRRRVWGRRVGRTLRAGRAGLLDQVLPEYQIVLPEGALAPSSLFRAPVGEVWLEIGFGGGEHLLAQADAHPAVGLIGCEPYIGGVSLLLKQIGARPRANLRLFADDARLLLAKLPAGAIGRAFILHPDPWPKKRHHERRIVSAEMLEELARVLRPGAELRLATDHAEYGVWMAAHLAAAPAFTLAQEWRTPARPDEAAWPRTRYEGKALAAGRPCRYFLARKTA